MSYELLEELQSSCVGNIDRTLPNIEDAVIDIESVIEFSSSISDRPDASSLTDQQLHALGMFALLGIASYGMLTKNLDSATHNFLVAAEKKISEEVMI